MSWIAGLLAGLLSGTLGALGLGGGSVLILYLTLFAGLEQSQAQGINLVFFIPCALAAIWLHSRKGLIEWRIWLWTAGLGVAGALLGSWLSMIISGDLLKKLFGGLLLLFGLHEILHKKKQEDPAQDASSRKKEDGHSQ